MVLEPLTHTGKATKQTNTGVQSMLKSTSVSFSIPEVLYGAELRTLIFSKSPSVASHCPSSLHPLLCLPPSLPPPPLHLTLLHLDRKEFIAQLRSLLH